MNLQSPRPKGNKQPPLLLSKSKSRSDYDRHIRKIDTEQFAIRSSSPSSSDKSTSSYHSELEESLFKRKGIRQYTLEKRQTKEKTGTKSVRVGRATRPVRKFRVPEWTDNYYSSLLDWSYNNFICAASGTRLYFYNMALDDQLENSMYRLYSVKYDNEQINAIHFSPTSTNIALGYSLGTISFFDYFKEKTSVLVNHHNQRITTLEWYQNTVYSGSKDKQLKTIDFRSLKESLLFPRDHKLQICGVKAHASYVASGGNDNNVFVYDVRRSDRYLAHYYHEAAVKALDWVAPNVLVSGGGTTDRKIKFWRDGEGVFRSVDTGSQVCGLIASTNTAEVVSCQGFSLNQVIIWNMEGERELTVHAHQSRVLYCALSPGGGLVATGAGDQMVHVWRFFGEGGSQGWQTSVIR